MSKDSISKTKEKSNKITSKDGSICVSTENKTNLSDESKSTGKGAKKTKSGSTKPSGKTPPPKKRGRPPTKKPVEDKAPDSKNNLPPKIQTLYPTVPEKPINTLKKAELKKRALRLARPLLDSSSKLWSCNKQTFYRVICDIFRSPLDIPINKDMTDLEIARELLLTHEYCKGIGIEDRSDAFYFYESNRWKKREIKEIERELFNLTLDEHWGCTGAKIESVVKKFTRLAPQKPDRVAGLIAFTNGVLDSRTLIFSKHNQSFGVQSVIDIEYHREIRATPFFDKMLDTYCGDNKERRELVQFIIYLHMCNRHDLKFYTEIVGAGDSGKSTFVFFLEMLIGKEGCRSGELGTYVNGSHQIEAFVGASSIFFSEAGRHCGNFETIKRISGGERVDINPKHEKPYDIKIDAVIGVISNEPLIIPENTEAMDNRRILVDFDRVIPPEERDKNLLAKLKPEIPSIANKLISYFTPEKILEHEKISKNNGDKLRTLEKYDNIFAFIKRCLAVHEDEWTKDQWTQLGSRKGWDKECLQTEKLKRARLKLYDCYLLFCEDGVSSNPVTLNTFKTRLLKDLIGKFGLKKGSDFTEANVKQGKIIILRGVYIKKECPLLTSDDPEDVPPDPKNPKLIEKT
jgi:phage/plasmid-associated DNA primase